MSPTTLTVMNKPRNELYTLARARLGVCVCAWQTVDIHVAEMNKIKIYNNNKKQNLFNKNYKFRWHCSFVRFRMQTSWVYVGCGWWLGAHTNDQNYFINTKTFYCQSELLLRTITVRVTQLAAMRPLKAIITIIMTTTAATKVQKVFGFNFAELYCLL